MFAAQSTDYDFIAEVFMPIRIRRFAKTSTEVQPDDFERDIASVTVATTASYTDRQMIFRVLCGSI